MEAGHFWIFNRAIYAVILRIVVIRTRNFLQDYSGLRSAIFELKIDVFQIRNRNKTQKMSGLTPNSSRDLNEQRFQLMEPRADDADLVTDPAVRSFIGQPSTPSGRVRKNGIPSKSKN